MRNEALNLHVCNFTTLLGNIYFSNKILADILKVKSALKNTLNYQQFLQHHKMLKFCLPLCPSNEILEKKIGRIK